MDTTTHTTAARERGATTLDRQQWRSHPHFPQQTLLLGSHASFREVSAHLVNEAAQGSPARPIGALYRRWIAAMRSHEAYEEGKLYPYLERRFHAPTEAAEQGHAQLHEAHDAVVAALADAKTSIDGRAGDALHDALARHDQVLGDHLSLEEDLVIPLLLALSPEDFVEYCDEPLSVLLDRLDQRALNTDSSADAETTHG